MGQWGGLAGAEQNWCLLTPPGSLSWQETGTKSFELRNVSWEATLVFQVKQMRKHDPCCQEAHSPLRRIKQLLSKQALSVEAGLARENGKRRVAHQQWRVSKQWGRRTGSESFGDLMVGGESWQRFSPWPNFSQDPMNPLPNCLDLQTPVHPSLHCPVLTRILLSQFSRIPSLDVWLLSTSDPIPHSPTSPRGYFFTLVYLWQESCQAHLARNPPLPLMRLLVIFHSLIPQAVPWLEIPTCPCCI